MARPWVAALVIAVIAVAVDYLFHFLFLPETVDNTVIAFHESPTYFAAKLAVFALVAWVFLVLGFMRKSYGPMALRKYLMGEVWYGLIASSAFGLFYYVYPEASIGTGSMPIALKGLWGLLHWGAGTLAAGVYTRNWAAVAIGVALLATAGVALVAFGAALASFTILGY